MTLAERYDHFCATPSSINEHLGVLRDYASRCQSVCEFGVDIGQSTTAFLMGGPQYLTSWDLVKTPELEELFAMFKPCRLWTDGVLIKAGNTNWLFQIRDSREGEIPPADLLFIDSAHSYDQIAEELARHASQVRRWILCHDTVTFGKWGEAGEPQVGILPAIDEFLSGNLAWRVAEHRTNNNGLLILERTDG